MTTIKALSDQFLTANLRQLQSRFQTAMHQSQRAHRLPVCTLLCQTLSNHIFAKCHRSAQQLERISKAAKHSRSSACFVPALLPDEAALYKSDKPATSSLPRSLAHIDFHQIASSLCKQLSNRGDLRAPPNQCQTGSRILQIRIRLNLNSLPAALWSCNVYHGARRYIDHH